VLDKGGHPPQYRDVRNNNNEKKRNMKNKIKTKQFKKENIYLPLPNGKEAHITNSIHWMTKVPAAVELGEELWSVHAWPYAERGTEFASKKDALEFVGNLFDIAESARSILSKLTDGETPKDYNWFGCETDTELVAEIKATARGEKINLTPSTLTRVIDIMYFG
jgi:hypothetical protein